ncbi:MAG: hypothetical protein JO235_13110 [Chroococcidiopsidaceae cyanobacterium CP_BM_RX_35]|nr:hypothetical protein [Chroococcidiopsidaceae cyanobacterium CP_BM_RX_35]
MTKGSAKLVVGVLASLGVLTGSGIWVNRLLMPGYVTAQAQTNQHSQSDKDMSDMPDMMHHNDSDSGMSDMEHCSMSPTATGSRTTASLNVKQPIYPGQSFPLTITI